MKDGGFNRGEKAVEGGGMEGEGGLGAGREGNQNAKKRGNI